MYRSDLQEVAHDQSYRAPDDAERTGRAEYPLDPYSKAFGDRIVFLGTVIDDTAANDVLVQRLRCCWPRVHRANA
jgi:hypothetical protein